MIIFELSSSLKSVLAALHTRNFDIFTLYNLALIFKDKLQETITQPKITQIKKIKLKISENLTRMHFNVKILKLLELWPEVLQLNTIFTCIIFLGVFSRCLGFYEFFRFNS